MLEGETEKPMSEHRLTTSVIVADADRVLVISDETGGVLRWRLPRGIVREGESLRAAARRGFAEEVGLPVNIGELAFVAEFLSSSRTFELHFGFVGRLPQIDIALDGRSPKPADAAEARFIPTGELRAHIRHRPLVIAIETWQDERALRYHVFDLDRIPIEID